MDELSPSPTNFAFIQNSCLESSVVCSRDLLTRLESVLSSNGRDRPNSRRSAERRGFSAGGGVATEGGVGSVEGGVGLVEGGEVKAEGGVGAGTVCGTYNTIIFIMRTKVF